MARIRTVKPAYPKHKKVRAVSRDARLLNIHLWNLADDEGRLQELPQWIIGEVFPTDEDVTPVLLREWLGELQEVGLIARYEVDDEAYIQCHDFTDHQVINKAKPSEIPPPPAEFGDSSSAPVQLRDTSAPEVEVEREGEQGREEDAPAGAHQQIIGRLDSVAFARGIASPRVDAARKVCEEYADKDLATEVEKFVHYWTEGPGEKRPLNDVAWAWRGWLGRIEERPAPRQRAATSARDSVGDDLKRLEAEAARLRKDEEAAA